MSFPRGHGGMAPHPTEHHGPRRRLDNTDRPTQTMTHAVVSGTSAVSDRDGGCFAVYDRKAADKDITPAGLRTVKSFNNIFVGAASDGGKVATQAEAYHRRGAPQEKPPAKKSN